MEDFILTDLQRDRYDIAGPIIAQPFPPKWAAGYLNDAETQLALGVGSNWTGTSVPAAVGKWHIFDDAQLES